jgi:HEAT repeat protein
LGGTGDARAIDPLIVLLKDPSTTVQWQAIHSLGLIGEVAVQPLLLLLKGKEAKMRDYSISALIEIGDPAVEPLLALLREDDAYARGGAAAALGFIKDTRVIEPLIKTLGDKDLKVRQLGVSALVNVGKPAVETLIKGLQSAEPGVRENIVLVLGMIQDRQAIEPLLVALKDPERDVRAMAAWALGRFGDKGLNKPLQELMERETDGYVKFVVQGVLKQFEEKPKSKFTGPDL